MKTEDFIKIIEYIDGKTKTTKLFLFVVFLFILFFILIPGYLLALIFFLELCVKLSLGKLLLLSIATTSPLIFFSLIVNVKMLRLSREGIAQLIQKKLVSPAILALITLTAQLIAMPLYGAIILGALFGPKKWVLFLAFLFWVLSIKLFNFSKKDI